MHIEERGKSLIIRWRVDSKKYHKTLKNHNNPIGWSNAKVLMAAIENDIVSKRFDPTIYTQEGKVKKQNIDITASELFAKYAAHRMEGRELSHSSQVRFKGIASKLTQFLGDKPASKVTPDIAANVIAAWSEQASTRTIRAYLFDLAAAWDWAQQEDLYILSNINPWNNSLDRLKRVKLPAPKKPKPFTIAELKAIAQGFRNHPRHSYYTDAAIFVAHTACRFGEMAALRWLNVVRILLSFASTCTYLLGFSATFHKFYINILFKLKIASSLCLKRFLIIALTLLAQDMHIFGYFFCDFTD
ncbi:hypothetical protein [Chamaesiphon sp. VAR_48_metabat_403]|uniref:hypothetical protein n=1 Tax=Chamaesiphon sp. VAR_48_metabat_403 TaxID=2964700 RepID=UPI00286E7F6C|nr:hypothetical protein [Chamaesiphon sp. VAR_48_metabat_403]